MKRFRISVLVLLLCSILLFTGCTKAKRATIESINNLYISTIEKYGKDSSGKIRVFDYNPATETHARVDVRVDLYSAAAYSTNLSNLINDKTTTTKTNDTASNKFNILIEGGEYQVLVKAITDFFAHKSYPYKFIDVPQSMHTRLYEVVDSLESTIKNIINTKHSLEVTINNFGIGNASEVPVQESFKLFLNEYNVLVEKLYQMNKTYEEIYTGYVNPAVKATAVNGGVPERETARLLYSSELYLAEYYYQKHMVLTSAYDTNFASRYYATEQVGQTVDNPNYDAMFDTFKEIVNNISEEEPANRTDANVMAYYNAGLQKLETLKNGLKNYTTAVQKVRDYKNSHDGEITADSSVYHYVQFMAEFDTQVVDYQNYIMHHIMGM